jgi:hypothetical protein
MEQAMKCHFAQPDGCLNTHHVPFGRRIIAALEGAWVDLQAEHSEIHDVVMITGTSKQQGGDRWGHHWPQRWKVADAEERMPELFAAGELLALGGRQILQTFIHEAAHDLAYVRGIQDTSRQGRYHNRRFAQLAQELGLTPPDTSHKVLGLSDVQLSDETAERYAQTIKALDDAALAYLLDLTELATGGEEGDGGEAGKKTGGRSGRRHAVECACEPPRRLQLTPKALDDGPVLCGNCREPFAPAGSRLWARVSADGRFRDTRSSARAGPW